MAMGLSSATCRQIIVKHSWPHRRTLDRFAEYFGVDRAALQALRPREKAAVRVAQGKKLAEQFTAQLTPEERGARARAALAVANSAPMEERQRRSSYAGRVGALRSPRTPSESRAVAKKAASTRREREGGWWAGDRARSQREDLKALRNGVELPCLFCRDPARPVYRSASRSHERGYSHYHQECFAALRRTKEDRTRAAAFGVLGWVWRQVQRHGDAQLKKRVGNQVSAQRAHLHRQAKGVRGPGRTPTLLRDRDLAIQAALLCDEAGLTTPEIGELAGWSTSRDARGNKGGSRWAWEMVRLGRVLLGRAAGADFNSASA